jgi:hypothetical protein
MALRLKLQGSTVDIVIKSSRDRELIAQRPCDFNTLCRGLRSEMNLVPTTSVQQDLYAMSEVSPVVYFSTYPTNI